MDKYSEATQAQRSKTTDKIHMKKEFNVIIEKDKEGYFVASVPSLHGCHTQAKSLDVLMPRIQEAINLTKEENLKLRSCSK